MSPYPLNYFCGYIDQTIFHQASDKVIDFMNAKLSERAKNAQKCSLNHFAQPMILMNR